MQKRVLTDKRLGEKVVEAVHDKRILIPHSPFSEQNMAQSTPNFQKTAKNL